MTYLCPSLSWPEFDLEQNWDQSGIRIFFLGIDIKALPSVSSSESTQSTEYCRFSFLQPKSLLCHLLCLFLPPTRPLIVLNQVDATESLYGIFPSGLLPWCPSSLCKPKWSGLAIHNSNNYYWLYFICITHLSTTDTDTYTHAPDQYHSHFSQEKAKLSNEVKKLTNPIELHIQLCSISRLLYHVCDLAVSFYCKFFFHRCKIYWNNLGQMPRFSREDEASWGIDLLALYPRRER